MNKRFAFLLTLFILVPVILAACGGDDDEGGDVSGEALTNAFEEMLAGNPEPMKELACEEQHANIDEAATEMAALTGEEGFDFSISCDVDGDAGSCEMSMTMEIEGQDPIESSETIPFTLEDGKICEDLGATP